MEIRCPYCEKTVQIPGGGQFTCPSCRAIFAVDLDPAAPPAPSPAGQAPTQPTPPPLPEAGAAGADPGAPPPLPAPDKGAAGGPICAKHPGRPAAEVCRRCGNFMCSLCVIPLKNERYCPDCIDKVGTGAGGTGTIPWENEREKLGIVNAYVATAKAVLLDGDKFFANMPTDAGLGAPIGFWVLFGSIFGVIGALLGLVFNMVMLGALVKLGPGGNPALGPEQLAGPVIQIVIVPFAILMTAFVGGAFYHVVALLCGGTGSYEATVRILCYSYGATAPFNAIPLVNIVGYVWSIVCHYYGFKHVHRLTNGKALLCATWPILFLCCCGLAAVTLIVGGAAAGGSGGGSGGF